MKKRFISQEEKVSLVKEFESSGLSIVKFADLKGVPRTTLRGWVFSAREGKPITSSDVKRNTRKPKHKTFTPEQRADYIRQYKESGLSVAEFAKNINVSKASIRVWLKAKDGKLPNLKKKSSPTIRDYPMTTIEVPEIERSGQVMLVMGSYMDIVKVIREMQS